MKVAVTGASGYIGRHVLAALARQGVRPMVVTRDRAHLGTLGATAEVLEMDIADPQRAPFAALGKPDVLIHLAWGGLPYYQSLHHFETELWIQYRFLKSMVQAGLPSMLVTGTCLEYGLVDGKLSEDLQTDPATSYGLAKDTLRKMLQRLNEQVPFSLAWARLFYSYGEGQSGSSLFQSLQACLRNGDSEFRMSGGEQMRDFLPVERLAEMLVSAALSGQDLGVVNLCSGVPTRVKDMVDSWIQQSSHRPRLDLGYYPYPSYEPMAFWGDRTRWDNLMQRT